MFCILHTTLHSFYKPAGICTNCTYENLLFIRWPYGDCNVLLQSGGSGWWTEGTTGRVGWLQYSTDRSYVLESSSSASVCVLCLVVGQDKHWHGRDGGGDWVLYCKTWSSCVTMTSWRLVVCFQMKAQNDREESSLDALFTDKQEWVVGLSYSFTIADGEVLVVATLVFCIFHGWCLQCGRVVSSTRMFFL